MAVVMGMIKQVL